MSTVVIRKLLETALAAMPGALSGALPNKAFTKTNTVPHWEVYLLPGRPDGVILDSDFVREMGTLQVTLCYPAGEGTARVDAMADKLKAHFKRGSAWTAPGIRVLVERHPETGPGLNEPGWYRVPVRVPYVADVFTAG